MFSPKIIKKWHRSVDYPHPASSTWGFHHLGKNEWKIDFLCRNPYN